MGQGATNVMGRIASSIFQQGTVEISFQAVFDVPNGGVLFALPALLATGLLTNIDKFFKIPLGYYGIESIFIFLAFMALSRVQSMEKLRYFPPGEWGKMLGLDRAPEVKTIREKINILANNQIFDWSRKLCSDWMKDVSDPLASFYIDGHVRIYYGSQTLLPRHYVSRQRLCLRATTDYWLNAGDGNPFLVITKEVDPGLLKVLENDIIPVLEKEFPLKKTELEDVSGVQIIKSRFVIVFDREGYSPESFLKMRVKHIACQTYNKYPKENWPEEEFKECNVKLVCGEVVKMKIAERGTFLGGILWVREIRKISPGGHQTSIVSTNYTSVAEIIASVMFARWSQENFFKYARCLPDGLRKTSLNTLVKSMD